MKKLTPIKRNHSGFITPHTLDILAKRHKVKVKFDGKVMVWLNGIYMTRTEAFEVLTIIS